MKSFKEFLNERVSQTKQSAIPKVGDDYEGGVIGYIGVDNYLILSPKSALKRLTYQEALDYCNGLSLNGYSDWYFGSETEMEAIMKNNPVFSDDYKFTADARYGASTLHGQNQEFYTKVYAEANPWSDITGVFTKTLIRPIRKARKE